ncbi:hypothetical protein Amsp01_083660 [Amycolatopsis sp. NBRC 101858]|nr:hypothetical protein Amsp01_083660 [Amycolatopsis sp. NBRC 101858]
MLLRRIRDRIGREETLDLEALARDAGMTAADFLRRFQDAYGTTPHAYRRAAQAARTLTFDRVLETR